MWAGIARRGLATSAVCYVPVRVQSAARRGGGQRTPEGGPMRSRFALFQFRDLLRIVLPGLLLAAGAVWLALHLVDPAPPGTFIVSAASPGSPYYRYAERYQATFKRNGVKLEVRESAGSFANLEALS